MDLYEFQARQLLVEGGIPVPQAVYASTSHDVALALEEIGLPCVIKGQATIGHRGQAGGVVRADTRDEAILASERILPMSIHGHKVNGVLVSQAKNVLHEYYVSISVDRSSRDYDVLATASGGTEVEEIAREHPESVKRLHISPLADFDRQAALEMAGQIGFYHADVDQAADILLKMWKVFKDSDATLVEINPLAKVGDPDDESSKLLCALDAKISLDDNAAFRHPEWQQFDDSQNTDPLTLRARRLGLHYVRLDGQVGVIGNGAGLVMSSLDAVALAGRPDPTAGLDPSAGADPIDRTNPGVNANPAVRANPADRANPAGSAGLGSPAVADTTDRPAEPAGKTSTIPAIRPANFLDIGGGASADTMADCLGIVADDPQVQAILINVYGGITSCRQVAEGIVAALARTNVSQHLVIRFDGNEAAEGLRILQTAHNPRVSVCQTMEAAASQAVELARAAVTRRQLSLPEHVDLPEGIASPATEQAQEVSA